MAILKIKDETGKFVDIPAIQGAPGKDGAIQYEAGENIKIDGNIISALPTGLLELVNQTIDIQSYPQGVYLLSGKNTKVNKGTSTLFSPIGNDYCKAVLILVRANESGVTRGEGICFKTSLSEGEFEGWVFHGSTFREVNFMKTLTYNNTIEYTPTSDYHPATYKFVKDEIAAAITTTLEGEY